MKKSTTRELETAVFAARLRELIRDTKTTQKDLAKAIGAAKNTVSAYAHGLCSPTLPILVRIAKHFDVSMDYLAGLTDEKQTSESKPTPKRQRNDPWRLMAICNGCVWRRHIAAPSNGWNGTACMYTHETGIFRAAPPTDEHCDYYKSKTALAEWAAEDGRSKKLQQHNNTKGE